MTLRQLFINNLKNFRKKEKLSQIKLAEYCNTSPSYIGEIEIGRKFPSMEMIEKFADILKIEPYHFFKNQPGSNSEAESIYPRLPNSMKMKIKEQINISIDEIINKY